MSDEQGPLAGDPRFLTMSIGPRRVGLIQIASVGDVYLDEEGRPVFDVILRPGETVDERSRLTASDFRDREDAEEIRDELKRMVEVLQRRGSG